MPRVVLEQKALEALASEPRITLLKALLDQQRTVTQLSKVVGQDKAGVYRHLRKLADGGLVERDDAHGFTYYRLTVRGRSVVAPHESVRIALLLGATAMAGVIVAYTELFITQWPATGWVFGVLSLVWLWLSIGFWGLILYWIVWLIFGLWLGVLGAFWGFFSDAR